jgi:hypothetical protein
MEAETRGHLVEKCAYYVTNRVGTPWNVVVEVNRSEGWGSAGGVAVQILILVPAFNRTPHQQTKRTECNCVTV